MATPTIDTTFIDQFESEVHVAYQRMSSKLRGTIRSKTVDAESTYFPIIGAGAAGQKARNGQVPIMNLAHTRVQATMADYYAGEMIDKLDELKTNIEERGIAARSIAGAMGRKTDSVITTVMDGATNTTAHGSAGMTRAKVETVWEYFGNNDVPDDGERFWAVSPAGWTDLVNIDAFANADYVGADQLPLPTGITAKRWMGFLFFTFSGLDIASTTRKTFAWHRSAVGIGWNKDVGLDMTWQGKEQAWLAVGSMSLGAVIIDNTGLYEVQITE
jgi:hypothetical protein